MRDLIDTIAARTGLAPATAETAVGIVLSLVRNQGDKASVAELFAALPGAGELADRHGGDAGRGRGLLGALGGGLMGGPLAAVTRLQAAGLSMDQIKAVGSEVLAYARREAGEDLVKRAAKSIPGISGYL